MTKGNGREAPGKANREVRLAEELRANLARRKAQARSRRDGAADERPDGLDASGKPAHADEPAKHDIES